MSADHSTTKSVAVTIYALCDPDTLAVRYVGKANDLAVRMRNHRFEVRNKRFRTRKVNWLRSLKGRDPVVVVLDTVAYEGWEEVERRWIAEMRSRGCDLTNYADGGQTSPVEGKGHTEESKAKMRASAIRNGSKPPSRKGQKTTDETRKRLSEAAIRRGCKPPNVGGWNKGIRRTHCKNGHEYSPENTRMCVRPDRVHQVCRQCERRIMCDFRQRKKEVSLARR